MKSIVMTGGGTAGHIVPHLALYPYLKKHFDKFYYVGSGKQLEKDLMSGTGAEIFALPAPKFYRSFTIKNALIPYMLAKSVKEAKKLLEKLKPSVVFSKGGYCALPVCFAAFSLKIPVVCHESDISIGLANRLTYKKAKYFCTSFPETAKKFGGVCVGSPIRKELFSKTRSAARRNLKIDSEKPVLFITGGSQGSRTINRAVIDNIAKLTEKFIVIHQCGKGNTSIIDTDGYFQYEFVDMSDCVSACDVCISRAGSNTLFELCAKRVPTLCVPLKKGSRGDQIKNACFFASSGAMLSVDEDQLSEKIVSLVSGLYKDREKYESAMKKINSYDGAQKLAEIIINASGNK